MDLGRMPRFDLFSAVIIWDRSTCHASRVTNTISHSRSTAKTAQRRSLCVTAGPVSNFISAPVLTKACTLLHTHSPIPRVTSTYRKAQTRVPLPDLRSAFFRKYRISTRVSGDISIASHLCAISPQLLCILLIVMCAKIHRDGHHVHKCLERLTSARVLHVHAWWVSRGSSRYTSPASITV